jgi:hypothetical protein
MVNKKARDCNGDGVVNCEDYKYIHQHGINRCNAFGRGKRLAVYDSSASNKTV